MKKWTIALVAVLLLVSVLPQPVFAVSETEPNDTMQAATVIEPNTEITGEIKSYDDKDFYAVILPKDGYISVDFEILNPYVLSEVLVVNLYKEIGSVSGRNMYWPIGRVNGTMVMSTGVVGLRAGVYYISVARSYTGYQTGYKMKVNYTETEFCEIESNQTMYTSTEIKLGESYKGSISDAEDEDWYCINVPGNGYITVDFSHELVDSSKKHWSMTVYEADGKTNVEGHVSDFSMLTYPGNEAGRSTQIGLRAGTYYIKITSGESYTYNQQKFTYYSNVAYDLKVSFTKTDFIELESNDNDKLATEIKLNEAYIGQIMKESDEDWFKFVLPRDGYITVNFENKSAASTGDVQLRICRGSRYVDINGYDKDYGADSRYWSVNVNESVYIDQIGLSAGTYYIWFRGNYAVSYSFTVNYTQSEFTEHEANFDTSTSTEIDLNRTYTGTTSYEADEDFYSFYLEKSNELTVRFDHMAHDKTISYWKVVLYDSDGEKELKSFDIWGDTPGVLNLGTLPSERYYIKIMPGKGLATNAYRFSVVEKHDCRGEAVTTKEPTCTEEGLAERTCEICGMMFDYETIPAKGHSFGEWVTEYDATCDHDGKRHRQCTVCQLTEDGSIPQLTHKLGEWKVIRGNIIIPPIVKEQKCEYCGVTEVTEDWGYVWVTVLAGIAAIGLCAGVVAYFKAYRNP